MKRLTIRKRKTSMLRYKQIFALFFTFFLVFVLVSSVTYATMVSKQRERLRKQVEQSLRVDVNLMDQYVRRIHNAAYKFLYRVSVYSDIPPMGEYTPADYRSVSDLVEQLGELSSSISDYSYQIYFFTNQRHVLTTDGSYSFRSYFDRIYRHAYFNADYWLNKQGGENIFSCYPVDTVCKDNSTRRVVPLVSSWPKDRQTMTLVVELADNMIRRIMEENLTLDGQKVLCADPYGNAFFNTLDGELKPEELMALNNRVARTGEPTTLSGVTLNGKSYDLCGMQDSSELTYYVLTPSSTLTRAAYQTNRYLLVLFVGTMVTLFLLTIFFSNKLFHPIQEILSSMELLKKDNSIAVENWRQAESSLREQRELLEQYVNFAVLLARGSVVSAPLSQTEPYFFRATGLSPELLNCMVLELRFQSAYAAEFTDAQRSAVAEALPQVLRGMLSSRFPSYLARYDADCFVCFFNGGEDTREQLWDVLESLRGVFQSDACYCHISCGISGTETRPSGGLSAVVSQAFGALSQSDLERDGVEFAVVEYDPDQTRRRPVLVPNDVSRLYNLMRSGKKAELFAAIDEILDENTGQSVHYDTMKLIYIRLYAVAADYLLACNLDPRTAAEEFWDQVELEDSSKNPSQALKSFLGRCVDVTHVAASEEENISQVFSYITNHYGEELYLDLIAQRVNMNPKYLSRVFKAKVGITITEYIGMVRISKAKELLIKTDMKIEDIGTAVGFENRTTFFRLFKKIEGMPPNRFRKDNTP